jgi:phosphoglycolate phosphatase-like HAD superfamily hydrolase
MCNLALYTNILHLMKKIKAVIFDLDGTLANTLPLCIRAFRASVEPHVGRSVTDEEIIATFGPSEEGTIQALAPDFYDEGVTAYLRYYNEYHDMCPGVFDGIKPLLDALKDNHIRIAMVTGKGKKSADVSLEKFGITEYFEWIETGMPQGPRKPEGIQMILDKWPDLEKQDVIYVGDAPSDITACRQVGVAIVAAAWAETAEPQLLEPLHPDHIFYTVPAFADWLLSTI